MNNDEPVLDNALFEKLACVKCAASPLQLEKSALICPCCRQEAAIGNGIPDFISNFCIGRVPAREVPYEPLQYEELTRNEKPYRLKRIDAPLLNNAVGDVLEIGCGTCRLAPPLEERGVRYFGIDPSSAALLYGYTHRNARRLVCGQGERLPFRDASFDSLISGLYAYRFVNPKLGLPEARRALKKGGVFTFDLLNYWILRLKELRLSLGDKRFRESRRLARASEIPTFEFVRRSQIYEKAKKSGFRVEKIVSAPAIPIFHKLNNCLSSFYFRGAKTVYLGYDVIIILKAV